MLDSFPFLAATKGLSSSEIISAVFTISQFFLESLLLNNSFSKISFLPYKKKEFSLFFSNEISIPSIIFFGEFSPPIASTAILTLLFI